ncbi:type II secretion system protein [Sulfurimonas sediminis]|uniref:Type II secretion system protein n=1 Tax=Sulfurimonas sediminis TaxID=2590020 RepID=A0A7M1B444_9BACT|nr:type II secretion system protein [Sulfurimonas sediminis]QOP44296.1 type II secretion system protein [Sulfurimonas sediminis]
MVRRYAFTMIELIFAIVVISITVISLPMMNQAISKGIDTNLVQEAIFASSGKLNEILTYQWDENSTPNNSIYSQVIWTSVNDCNQTTKRRSGHIFEQKHRRCLDNNFSVVQPTAVLGFEATDNGIYNDMDDFNNVSVHLFIDNSGVVTSAEGYKNNYTMEINVSYADFNETTAASKNMKRVDITIKNSDGNITTKLHTYSANIGEVDYAKRSF